MCACVLTGRCFYRSVPRGKGLINWLAGITLRAAAGSRTRLFALVYLIGIVLTTVLSNDATAVVLTLAVYAGVKRAKVNPLPYLFACAFIVNAASFVLLISNPANLVMFANNLPPFLPWLRIFLLPSGAAILVTCLTMRLLFRRTLEWEIPNVPEDLRHRPPAS